LAESAAPPTGASPTLNSIQVLRAVAALSVVVHHTMIEKLILTGEAVTPYNFFKIGAAGVDLFFVISGFVMVYSSEGLFGRRDAPLVFILRRVVRIVPLYWATTLIVLGYFLFNHGRDVLFALYPPGNILASFLFYPYPRADGVVVPPHTLGWTLNYEMFFYAVFAVLILFSRWSAGLAGSLFFFCFAIVGSVFSLPPPFAFWFNPIVIEFCLGMLIAFAWREGVRLPPSFVWALVLVAIVALAISANWYPFENWRLLSWGLPSAAIVAACVLSRESAEFGGAGRFLAFLGDCSYSLYLIHPLVLPVIRRAMQSLGASSAFAYVAVAVLAAGLAGVVCYLLFERPVTRLLQDRIRNRWSTAADLRHPKPAR